MEKQKIPAKGAEMRRKRREMEKAHVLSYSGAQREKPLSDSAGNDGKSGEKSTLNKRICRFFCPNYLNSYNL